MHTHISLPSLGPHFSNMIGDQEMDGVSALSLIHHFSIDHIEDNEVVLSPIQAIVIPRCSLDHRIEYQEVMGMVFSTQPQILDIYLPSIMGDKTTVPTVKTVLVSKVDLSCIHFKAVCIPVLASDGVLFPSLVCTFMTTLIMVDICHFDQFTTIGQSLPIDLHYLLSFISLL
jgi:hypothetical protein